MPLKSHNNHIAHITKPRTNHIPTISTTQYNIVTHLLNTYNSTDNTIGNNVLGPNREKSHMTGANIIMRLAQVPGVYYDPHQQQPTTPSRSHNSGPILELPTTTPNIPRATFGAKITPEPQRRSYSDYSYALHHVWIIIASDPIRQVIERAPIGGDINWAMQHECMDGRASTWPADPYIVTLKVSTASKIKQLGRSNPYKTTSHLILSGRGPLGGQFIGGCRSRHNLEYSYSPTRQGGFPMDVVVLGVLSLTCSFPLNIAVIVTFS